MVNFWRFENIYLNLGDNCRNKILGNIFDITNVSVSNFIVEDNKIIFRIFANGIFYQYVFILGIGVNEIINGNKVICHKIFIYNENMLDVNKSIYYLIQCQDEYQVYQLVKQFL